MIQILASLLDLFQGGQVSLIPENLDAQELWDPVIADCSLGETQ